MWLTKAHTSQGAPTSISGSSSLDDKTIAKDLKEYSGLNLVDFYIVPHLNEFPFEESAKQTVEKYKDNLNIIAINNSQAIILKDNKFEIK